MPPPFTLKCAWCDYETSSPGDIVAHMVGERHGISDDVAASMADSSGIAEFERILAGLQDGTITGEPVTYDEMAAAMAEDDDEDDESS